VGFERKPRTIELPTRTGRRYAQDVIVVIGQPLYLDSEAGPAVDGLPARIALTAAALGRPVQLIGKAGEDAAGDAVVLALAQGGVGHVALLREAGRPTRRAAGGSEVTNEAAPETPAQAIDAGDEPPARGMAPGPAADDLALEAADVDLALRYLTEFGVLVLADPVTSDVVAVAAAAASWADSRLIVVVSAGETVPEGLPPDAIVFAAPDADPDGTFAAMVGSFAAALDDGSDPAEAFRSSVDAAGWTSAPGE
jgi:hypothetical protein